jgi:hydroxymethylbilane synthase
VRLATRGSALALAQAQHVATALGGAEIVVVRSRDSEVGDKSRFVSAVEEALAKDEADLGVHSAKDLPGDLADGLALVGVAGREAVEDACVADAASLAELPDGARVGTSSLRRRSQLLARRPDLEISELRGNVDTRLERRRSGDFDAIVLAQAGLARLGRADEVAFTFSLTELVPAPGQGALALEARAGDTDARAAAASITKPAALVELTAERAAVAALGASCFTPVGVCARLEGQRLSIDGYAGLPDGSEWVRDHLEGTAAEPAALGEELAERMLAAGAREILERAGAGT